MLHFHGIEIENGIPKKFVKNYNLHESLKRYVQQSTEFAHQQDRLIKWIDHKINEIYQSISDQDNISAHQRREVALFSRTKDMARFNFLFQEYQDLTFVICQNLLLVLDIEQKWYVIKQTILELIPSDARAVLIDQLSHQNSYFYQLIQFIHLMFLEQTEEKPPANLLLNFIPAKFPKHEWITTESAQTKRLMRWEAQEKYCRFEVLLCEMIKLFNESQSRIAFFKKEAALDAKRHKNRELIKTEVRFFDDDHDIQPMLIAVSPLENLLLFQDKIRKEFKNRGLIHFLAFLRQITSQTQNQICYFSLSEHLELVSNKNKNNIYNSKEIALAKSVLKKIEELYVIRIWQSDDQKKHEEKGYMLRRLKEKSSYKTNFQALNLPEIIYLVDDFFVPNKNQIHFGHALQLIPADVFQMSSKDSPLIPFLSSYFSLQWLVEFEDNQGILERSGREIIENCGLQVAPSDKYRIIYKLEEALKNMEKKSFIQTFHIDSSKEKNPWSAVYRIEANKSTIKEISSLQSQIKALSA